MKKAVNIVALNVPWPPDYGGIIDTFHRIRCLHEAGVEIHLHCFEYGRDHSSELESVCSSVNYYKRDTRLLHQFSALPYIVSTRKNIKVLENLRSNDYPILFDGIHTTAYLDHPALAGRKKIVRMHNIEHRYYRTLAANETSLFKKLYFTAESIKLESYEKILQGADHILTVSEAENEYFNKKFHNAVLIPSFHPFDKVESDEGSGSYIIYHADLSVNENSSIAAMLIEDVFSNTDFPSVIAGRKPPEWLVRKAGQYKNVSMVADPGPDEMNKLIREAHINILPVTKMVGLKLKLLYALFSGRHLIINSEMAKSLAPGDQYHIADKPEEMLTLIRDLIEKPFTSEMVSGRERLLTDSFNNKKNIEKLIGLI